MCIRGSQLSEKAKFYHLKEARGLRFPNLENTIPSDLIEKEKQSSIALSQAVSKYENLLDQKSKPKLMLSLINSIDSLKRIRGLVIDEIKSKSPMLSKYLDIYSTVDIEEAKNYLAKIDRVYISYFLSGNEFIENNYAFVITPEGLSYKELAFEQDNLDTSIKNLVSGLKIDLNNQTIDADFEAFKKPAAELYNLFISNLSIQSKKGLIFNLHNNLHAIPFEVLKASKNEKYLIQERNVSYTSSIGSLLEVTDYSYDKNLLASCPVFTVGNALGLSHLENNKHEVKEIANLVGYRDISKANSKHDFLKNIESNSFNIIHLATHAAANQKRGHKSYLAFGEDSTQLLYSREIFGLPIKANLVVLSACQSGEGEVIESQGVLGLSTAFAATNTKSMVASLWNVNDIATRKLMRAYYSHLNGGKYKDEALRQSKLDYLSSVPKSKQHPYYWASFIQIGSIDALQFDRSQNLSMFGISIFAILMLTVFLFLIGRNKKRAASI